MKRALAAAVGVTALLAGRAPAFGPCVPATLDQLKCQDAIARALGKMIVAVSWCHRKLADAAFRGIPADDEPCETLDPVRSARGRFDLAVAKIAPRCPLNPDPVSVAYGLSDFLLGPATRSLEQLNGIIYCEGTAPLGGDDAGTIPSTREILRCEDAAVRNVAKLFDGLLRCQMKGFDSAFKGVMFDLTGCEVAVRAKYDGKVASIVGKGTCPPCLDAAVQTSLGRAVQAEVEEGAALLYPCVNAGVCGNPEVLRFTTVTGSGNCGEVRDLAGGTLRNLACGVLYLGGGGSGATVPVTVPDSATFVTRVNGASGNLLSLIGADGSDPLADARTCTAAGCPFGAPMPIASGTAFGPSCLVNTIAADASGTVDCTTGALTLDVPLAAEVFLTGDLFPAAPGTQSCPVCNRTCTVGGNAGGPCNTDVDCPGGGAGSCAGANVCHGGPQDGASCTPANSASSASYPTSHDCPPDLTADAGGVRTDVVLTTATAMNTAVASGTQQRVFCGYCRDPGAGTFMQPARACLQDGTAIDPGCPGTFDCQQSSDGGFGPAGGSAKTITEQGTLAGDLRDGQLHATTLGSVVCLPPTFNPTIDGAAGWPGPGAMAVQGQTQLQ